MKIFIYGTLKRGCINHNIISNKKDVAYLGVYSTINCTLYLGTYPYLVKQGNENVIGELYNITNNKLISKLDIFEGSPDYYKREIISIYNLPDETIVEEVQAYILQDKEVLASLTREQIISEYKE